MRPFAIILVLVLCMPAAAQRKITGRVARAQEGTPGAPVPGLSEVTPGRGNWVLLTPPDKQLPPPPFSPGPAFSAIDADGSFEFQNVSPGTYRLQVVPAISVTPLDVVVEDRDLTGVVLGAPRFRVSGVVVTAGGVAPRLQVSFADAATGNNPIRSEAGTRFQTDLPEGEYRVSVSQLPAGYSLAGITAGAANLAAGSLRVTADGAPEIQINLTALGQAPAVRVRGRLEGKVAGQAPSVLLSGPAMAETLTATVRADGAFEFPRVLPGRYEARLAPSPVSLPQTVDVGTTEPPGITIVIPGSTDFAGEFVRIRPGEFMMGCSPDDTTCVANELPAHRVTIARPFEIGRYEVTQAQWEAVMGANPSQFTGPDRPVENINRWEDAEEFIARLNAFNDGYRYRLPTEAEWEFAARAGTTGPFAGNPDDVAWNSRNSGRQTHPVGQKQPNAWGLYDMMGNVGEWVSDWYDPVYYGVSPPLDPVGPATGSTHAVRGGSAMVMPVELRVSYRGIRPNPGSDLYGFRIVREPAP